MKNYLLSIVFLLSFMFGFFPLLNATNSPGKVLRRIDQFFNNRTSGNNLSDVERYTLAMKDLRKIEKFYHQLLESYYMCQVSLDSDDCLMHELEAGVEKFSDKTKEIDRVICMMQEGFSNKERWSRQFKLIRADCACNCIEYKPEIHKKIAFLSKEYNKLRAIIEK